MTPTALSGKRETGKPPRVERHICLCVSHEMRLWRLRDPRNKPNIAVKGKYSIALCTQSSDWI